MNTSCKAFQTFQLCFFTFILLHVPNRSTILMSHIRQKWLHCAQTSCFIKSRPFASKSILGNLHSLKFELNWTNLPHHRHFSSSITASKISIALRNAVKMQFQVMSDLHLEMGSQYTSFNITQRAPNLILAGDIGRLCDYDPLKAFLIKQIKQFERVFFVLGNHEFYGVTRQEGIAAAARLRQEADFRGRFTLLDRTRVDLSPSVTILGCTLYPQIQPSHRDVVARRLNDFHQPGNWTPERHNSEHAQDLAWLRGELENIQRAEPDRRVLVVTHYAPSLIATSKPGDVGSDESSAFCTDVIEQQMATRAGNAKIKAMIKYWVFGHTHLMRTNQVVNGVRLFCNQRGYVRDPKVEWWLAAGGGVSGSDDQEFDVDACIAV